MDVIRKDKQVNVYQNACKQTGLEGRARLVSFVCFSGWWEGKRLEVWKVNFNGDSKHAIYNRSILFDV